ncbi:hypothetical protein PIB30_019055 [Stylosanthes scabra]|uniref:Uncharacterized protein n=1 Tax=Stylosanthes scabra TaxID=79078 RepID=A0ABU6T7X7_9FABA|nr:hypothetical protein [Stylosanthes scabra]
MLTFCLSSKFSSNTDISCPGLWWLVWFVWSAYRTLKYWDLESFELIGSRLFYLGCEHWALQDQTQEH